MSEFNWESLTLILLGLAVTFWWWPGLKHSIQASKGAPRDWPAVLLPLALVVIFVLFLLSVV